MGESFRIPASTMRVELTHHRRRSFRWRFLLELVASVFCCGLLLLAALVAMLTDSPVFPDDPLSLLGRMWSEHHHLRFACFDAEGALLHAEEHEVLDAEDRDLLEREALSAAKGQGLPLLQCALGVELARWEGGWIQHVVEAPLDSLVVDGSTARWTQEPGPFSRLLRTLGLWSPAWVAVRLEGDSLIVDTRGGPSTFALDGLLAVRFGPVVGAGPRVSLGPDQLCVVGDTVTEAFPVSDRAAGAALANFIHRGLRERCTDSSC